MATAKAMPKKEATDRLVGTKIVAVQLGDGEEVKIETDRGDVLVIKAGMRETLNVSIARLVETEVQL